MYFNAVSVFSADTPADELKLILKAYELTHGRTSEARSKGLVPIDLDLVIVNNEIVRRSDYDEEYFQIGYRQIKKD